MIFLVKRKPSLFYLKHKNAVYHRHSHGMLQLAKIKSSNKFSNVYFYLFDFEAFHDCVHINRLTTLIDVHGKKVLLILVKAEKMLPVLDTTHGTPHTAKEQSGKCNIKLEQQGTHNST